MSLSDRMRKYLGRKVDPYQAFLKVQIHMVDLAHVYIDQIVYQSLHSQLEKIVSVDNKSMMEKMSQLFGLDLIYHARGWFLENDYMSGPKSKAIRRVRTKLMQEIRPEVGGLVNAFNIPDELLAAAIVV
jgi:acyl-CoA oxidase